MTPSSRIPRFSRTKQTIKVFFCSCGFGLAIVAAGELRDLSFEAVDYVRNDFVSRASALALSQGWQPPDPSLDECIEQAAETHALHPLQIRAMIEVESKGNPGAISPKGALGLMQVMPATARRFGYTPAEMLQNECKNVDAGARRLAEAMQFAYQEYNGGPGCIGKCLESIRHGQKVRALLVVK